MKKIVWICLLAVYMGSALFAGGGKEVSKDSEPLKMLRIFNWFKAYDQVDLVSGESVSDQYNRVLVLS
jgi:hypothetical protein